MDANVSMHDPANWALKLDRRLFRDVRTISGGVLIIVASVVGNEILFDASPTDGSIYKQVRPSVRHLPSFLPSCLLILLCSICICMRLYIYSNYDNLNPFN